MQSIVGRVHLEVISVNFKEDRRDFNAVIRSNKNIDLRYFRDPKGRISDSYGVNSLPNMFIVDVDGKVAHVHRGYSEEMIDGFIREMLALLPPAALAKPANGRRRRLRPGTSALGRERVRGESGRARVSSYTRRTLRRHRSPDFS